MRATLENASRAKKQLLTKCILSVSDGKQMEQGLYPLLYLPTI